MAQRVATDPDERWREGPAIFKSPLGERLQFLCRLRFMQPFRFIRNMNYGRHLFQLFKRYMTFDGMSIHHNLHRRHLIITNITDSSMAAGAEWAALGWIHCTWQVSFQNDFSFSHFRIGNRYR